MKLFHISVAILSFFLVFVSLVRAGESVDRAADDAVLDDLNNVLQHAAAPKKPEVYKALELKGGETVSIPADAPADRLTDSKTE